MSQRITQKERFGRELGAVDAIDLVAESGRQPASLAPETFVHSADPATGAHRQLLMRPCGGYPLAGGWYLFELDLRALDQPLSWAAFYPDYGKGMSEENRLPLPMVEIAPGRHQAIARFTHDLINLRFDASAAGCELELGQARLRKLSKLDAARRMLRAVFRSTVDLGKKTAVLLTATRKLCASGPNGFAAWLYREYSQGPEALRYNRYHEWVELYGKSIPADINTRIDTLSYRPLISVVVSTCNTPEKWLRQCIDSVIEQHYPHWELCIADNASDKPHIRLVLNEYLLRDERIKVTFRERHCNGSDALNSAIDQASGDYIAVVGDQDELHPLALYRAASAASEHPEWKLIYSDEDKIDGEGKRFDPYFKPDWNYELLLSQNYIHHLCVFDGRLLKAVGGFRNGFDGSEDYDLLLRCIERLRPSQIGHVPIALYHWRAASGSSLPTDEHDCASKGAVRALQQHLQRISVNASVTTESEGIRRVRFHCPTPAPLVSLIVPTRNKVQLLRRCVDSILRSTYPNYEIIVVDNGSSDAEALRYMDRISRLSNVQVLRYDAPFNYSAINNYAVRHAAGDVIGLVNNDIEVIAPDWMEEMVSHAIRPDIGAVGAMLYYPDGTIQHAGVIVGLGGVAGHAYLHMPRGYRGYHNRGLLLQNVSAVTAACLFVRREVFNAVGGLDESLAVAFNDIDFCLRVRDAGYRNVWTPYAQMYHMESASRGSDKTPEQQARFQRESQCMRSRWGERLLKDPAYNSNLSLGSHCSDLAFPPRH